MSEEGYYPIRSWVDPLRANIVRFGLTGMGLGARADLTDPAMYVRGRRFREESPKTANGAVRPIPSTTQRKHGQRLTARTDLRLFVDGSA